MEEKISTRNPFDDFFAADHGERPDWRDSLDKPMTYPDDFQATSPSPAIPPMADVLGPTGIIAERLPGYEHRPQQLEAAEAIRLALRTGKHAVIEAGTGVGKSLAYLIPAIYSDQKTIVATSGKALQDQLSQKDLPFLRSVLPVEFDFATLKGRSNYVCQRKAAEVIAAPALLGDQSEAQAFADWLATTETGDVEELAWPLSPELRPRVVSDSDDCLGDECPMFSRCHYRNARIRAEEAQIVVVNHTLLALDCSIRWETSDLASILPDRNFVIIDEAHAVEETATRAFEESISSAGVESLLHERLLREHAIAGIRAQNPKLDTRAVEQAFADAISKASSASTALFEGIAPQGAYPSSARITLPVPARTIEQAKALSGHLSILSRWVEVGGEQAKTPAESKAVESLVKRIEDAATTPGTIFTVSTSDVVFVEQRRTRNDRQVITLKRCPISISQQLSETLFDRWPTICTSATLSANNGFGYFKSRVGLDGNTVDLQVGSPFDYASHSLLYLPPKGAPFDPTTGRGDGSVQYFDRLADEIGQLLMASDGRAFCLFTSNKALNEVYSRLAGRLRWQVLKQGDVSRGELVRRFKEDGHAVAFLTRSFFEGVDVQGEALSLVVIDKLPFPSPEDPIYSARCDALNRERGDKWAWFRELAIPIATIATKQAFGRLIRTKTDRGVVALLDGRITLKGYGTGLVRSLPPATMVRSLAEVRTFFQTREVPYRQEGML